MERSSAERQTVSLLGSSLLLVGLVVHILQGDADIGAQGVDNGISQLKMA